MKLNCNIDGQSHSIVVESTKPLNKILTDIVPSFPITNSCLQGKCGNCVVIIDGECTLSCIVPAFKLNGSTIQTFEGFSRTRAFSDIRKAYEITGIEPCRQCFASKTLIVESILRRFEAEKEGFGKQIIGQMKTKKIDIGLIQQELEINGCPCIEDKQFAKIIEVAYELRRKRNGRSS